MSDEEPMSFGPDDLPPEAQEALDRFFEEHPHLMNDGVAMFTEETMEMLPEPVRLLIAKVMASKLVHATAQGMISGREPGSDRLNDQYMASNQQLSLNAGDKCVVSYGGVEDQTGEILLVELVDPAEHETDFPDWEERVYNGWLLGKYWTKEHAEVEMEEPDLGWFSRISLLKIHEDWQWPIYWEWMKAGTLPADPPAWLLHMYVEIFKGISENNDNLLPIPTKCEACSSEALLVVTKRWVEAKFFVGSSERYDEKFDRENGYYGFTRYGVMHDQEAHLQCYDCEHVQDIPSEQLFIGVDGGHNHP
jgi:hypothetical protein